MRAALVCLAALLFAGNAHAYPVPARPWDQTLIFDNSSTPLVADYRGVNVVHMSFTEMSESIAHGVTPTLAALEYERMAATGVHQIHTWYGPDWACGTSYPDQASCDYSSTKMQAFYSWLQKTKDAGIEVYLRLGLQQLV